jgi:hypothetical protein
MATDMKWIPASDFKDRLHYRRQCGRIIRSGIVDYYTQVLWDDVGKFWFIDAQRKVDRPEFLEILDETPDESLPTDEQLQAYKKLLRIAGVPDILIEHPNLIDSQEITGADREWAMKAIAEYEKRNTNKPSLNK